MKVKEFLETMKNSMVLESPKLRVKNSEKHITKYITIRLNEENYYKYTNKEVISWDLCLTKIDFKDSKLYGYLVIEVENV